MSVADKASVRLVAVLHERDNGAQHTTPRMPPFYFSRGYSIRRHAFSPRCFVGWPSCYTPGFIFSGRMGPCSHPKPLASKLLNRGTGHNGEGHALIFPKLHTVLS